MATSSIGSTKYNTYKNSTTKIIHKYIKQHNQILSSNYLRGKTYFEILLKKFFQEWCIACAFYTIRSNVIDTLLLRFHVLKIFIQTDHHILTLGREKSKQWSNTLMIFTIFNATQFQMLSKIFEELFIILQ